jgi:cytochrome c oxidase subunit 2
MARIAVIAALLLLALLLTGCDAETPQNTFDPVGPVARDQRDIFYYAMWPAIAVMILVEVGLVVLVLRFRRRDGDAIPKQTHGNTPLELAWTIAPAILLAVLAVPMMIVLFRIGREPADNAFVVNVEGQRFSWFFEYPDIQGPDGKPLKGTKPGEVHFPVGEEIAINLTAIDVIHSFAIPRIAGTRDAIPSEDLDGDGRRDHVETFWIRVDEPGTFAGQCRELCGTGHAEMLITAYAQSREDFDAWAEEELASAYPGSGDRVETRD